MLRLETYTTSSSFSWQGGAPTPMFWYDNYLIITYVSRLPSEGKIRRFFVRYRLPRSFVPQPPKISDEDIEQHV